MKIYRINVNGKRYEVELEAVSETNAPVQTSSKPTSAKTDANIQSPMQGKIVKCLVKTNQVVKKGQVLCILEAMKLENEILAYEDGMVKSILFEVGQHVEAKQDLFVIG